jgi:SAM-dependent methyltransferase
MTLWTFRRRILTWTNLKNYFRTENLTVYPPPQTSINKPISMPQPDEDMMQLHLSQQAETLAKIPGDLEKKYVYEVYDKIADHFSSTRYKPWPRVVEFLDSLPLGSLVGDIGCGNGKYLFSSENVTMLGSDISNNLLKICQAKSADVFVADSLNLPVKSESLDHAISIAVIHHFSTPAKRVRAIEEIVRVTKKGGKCLLYVWAMEQDERKFGSQDIFVPWNLQKKFEQKKGAKGGKAEDLAVRFFFGFGLLHFSESYIGLGFASPIGDCKICQIMAEIFRDLANRVATVITNLKSNL